MPTAASTEGTVRIPVGLFFRISRLGRTVHSVPWLCFSWVWECDQVLPEREGGVCALSKDDNLECHLRVSLTGTLFPKTAP